MAYRPLTDIPISLLTNSSTMASGYVLEAYVTGTTTPATLYSDANGTSAGASVTLDARGEPTTIKRVWLDTSVNYKLILKTGAGVEVWTADPVYGTPLTDVVSVLSYAADPTGVSNSTTAIQNALNAHESVYFPVGTYLVSSINIPAGRTLITEGVAVKFKQIAGSNTRVFIVTGSNVTIGDMTIEGNIATDTGEFNHGVAVASGWAGTSLNNISIGNIKGIDIRGDVVYIGQTLASGTTSNVRLASADGNNIYRNVVSVVSGSDIEIGQVTGSAVGYMHVDIEPDSDLTGPATNVRVKQVKGRHIGIVVNSPGTINFNQNIRFDEVNLDPAFATQSTPSYSPGASILPRAVHLRSVRSAHIGSLRVNGFNSSAIWSVGGGVGIESIVIDQCVITDCAKNDPTYYSYIQCANLTIGYLYAVTQAAASAQRVIAGNNCVIQSGNITLGNNSSVVRSATNANIQNCVISGAGATGTYVAFDADGARFANCTVSNVERFAGFMDYLVIDSSTATLTTAVLNTVTNAVYIRSTINSQHYAFAAADRAHTNAIAFGSYFLWVDATGDLRIKNGAPTTDTDGTVVGTQT